MASSAARLGSVLGNAYELERLLGKGGMGSVYEAHHTRLPKKFAVKVLDADISERRDLFERFKREAEIVSSLGHENIVGVVDFNYDGDGVPYMVLELLEGEDLASRIASRAPLSLDETTRIIEQVCNGLEAAHAQGIVHRDLKPQNIFLCRVGGRTDEVAKILDFGISKIVHSTTMSTRTGTVMGTPNYMSPEQADGKRDEIDARTDIFAVGAIAYECLTGKKAFDGPTTLGTLYQVCNRPAERLRNHAPEVPAAVERVIDCALIKRRSARYQSIGALRDELLAAASGETPALATSSVPEPDTPTAPTIDRRPGAADVESADTVEATTDRYPDRGRRPRPLLFAAGGAVAVALVVAVWQWRAGSSDGASDAPLAHEVVDVAAADARVREQPGADELDVEAPATVPLLVEATPDSASATLDGEPIELDELLELANDNRQHTLVVDAPGHVPITRTLTPDGKAIVVSVVLRKDAGNADETPRRSTGKRSGHGRETSTRPLDEPVSAPPPAPDLEEPPDEPPAKTDTRGMYDTEL